MGKKIIKEIEIDDAFGTVVTKTISNKPKFLEKVQAGLFFQS